MVEHLCRRHRPTGEREVLAQLPLGLRLGHPAFELHGVEPRFAGGAAQGLFLVEQLAREVAHPQAPEQRTHAVGFVATSRDDGATGGDRGRHPRPLRGVDGHPVVVGDSPERPCLLAGAKAALLVVRG